MKAFSFLEVIISVVIASIVFVAVFALAFQNLTAAEVTRDRFIAANLAQEGIEAVVNMRSGNWLNFKDDVDLTDGSLTKWRGETGCAAGDVNCLVAGTYIVQYNTTAAMPDTNALYNPSLVADASGKYCHIALNAQDGCAQNKSTLFSRTIRIEDIPGNNHQMKVVVTVSWPDGTVQVESRLYNWR